MSGFSLSALAATAVLAVLFFFSARVFRPVWQRVRRNEGRVESGALGLPDLLVFTVLATWLGGSAVRALLQHGPPREMTLSDLLQSAVLFGVILAGIFAFLSARQIGVTALFGLRRLGWTRVAGAALRYLLAAYPVVLVCTALTQALLGEGAKPQEIMQYFVDAVESADRRTMAITIGMAVGFAPLAEELLFRGYFYGTLRRAVGPFPAMAITAGLFAAIHGSAMALPALFVLACAFTLAYEATGSLWVPIVMHALFNGTALVVAYLSAQQG